MLIRDSLSLHFLNQKQAAALFQWLWRYSQLQCARVRGPNPHDACAGPCRKSAIVNAGGSNNNGKIHISAEGNMSDGAIIGSAGSLFEFGNDLLHGPDLERR